MPGSAFQRLAAVVGAAGVLLGALGAHGPVHDVLISRHSLPLWEKAVFYHLIHAILLCSIVQPPAPVSIAAWLILAGVLAFSGSLYILALAHTPFLAPLTPIGGLSLVAGWICLAVRPGAKDVGRQKV
jgi:uncharacterized membrane protein YgdD (TMEM256/DUF423 family)